MHSRHPVPVWTVASTVGVLLGVLLNGSDGRADARFAVVNTSGRTSPPVLLEEIEREIQRLRPGVTPITDPVMKKLLATGEQPFDTVARLLAEAEEKRQTGDCAAAMPLAIEAETLAFEALALNEERDLLKRIYVLAVSCEDLLGRPERRDVFARRLRAMVALPPDTLPVDLWEQHVANATPGEPSVELQIDSEPPNAQVAINFHGDGVTPRTLKVPRGEVLVEVQKEGYKKAFRRLEADGAPLRTVFRLVDIRQDRVALGAIAMRVLAKDDPDQRPRTLSQLAQWARADLLFVLRTDGDRVRIWQFDAERGALAREVIESPFDRETGRVAALAARATPGQNAQESTVPSVPGVLAPGARTGASVLTASPENEPDTGLPTTFAESKQRARAPKSKAPWWGWLIAAAVAGGIAAVMLSDRQKTGDSLDVTARYEPPR